MSQIVGYEGCDEEMSTSRVARRCQHRGCSKTSGTGDVGCQRTNGRRGVLP